MLFNSLPFIQFFTIFFFLYWFVFGRNLRFQNLLVLIASYVFYGWWNWHFLFLLVFSSLITYFLGLAIYKAPNLQAKKRFLTVGIVAVLAPLLFFKYTNFFILSISSLFQKVHFGIHLHTLSILLPLAISFYTFRMLSYLIEVKRGKFIPIKDWVVFFSYSSFFPSLISGPIDRPNTLIPQLEKPRVFDKEQAIDGMRQILWGLFKKVVIADNCGVITKYIFETTQLHGSILILGAFLYTIQMYTDFSGYSDMAIGIARLIGFNITRNFNYPYFSQNISEFWRKWHMSLTSWLSDYIFTPLSMTFRDFGDWGSIIAIIITFLVSGLWHGANYTFILWGFLHGCYFIPLILKGKMNKKKEVAIGKLPSLKEFFNIVGTFSIVMFTMILFRSDSIANAFHYYHNIVSGHLFSGPMFFPMWYYLMVMVLIVITFYLEWLQRDKQHALQNLELKYSVYQRWIIYNLSFLLIMIFSGHEQQFVYFKF